MQPIELSVAKAQAPFKNPKIGIDMRAIGIPDAWGMLATYLMDREGMLRFSGEGPLNSDLHPLLEFAAPRSLFRNAKEHGVITRNILLELESASMGHYPLLADDSSLLIK